MLDVWSTWDALGLVQAKFGEITSFLQSLSKALHEQDGHDGSPMVSVPLIDSRRLPSILLSADREGSSSVMEFCVKTRQPGLVACSSYRILRKATAERGFPCRS